MVIMVMTVVYARSLTAASSSRICLTVAGPHRQRTFRISNSNSVGFLDEDLGMGWLPYRQTLELGRAKNVLPAP